MADGSLQLDRRIGWVASDSGARWAFRLAVVLAIPVWFVVGRKQWYIRDDWAFLLTRPRLHQQFGIGEWLFQPQDGHWMSPPILIYRATQLLFGLGSYWPYLVPLLALHLGIVLAVRALCRRAGATEWTTTMVCAVLLVLGSGWENIMFAIQITYNMSLLAFLVHLLLADHDGPIDRRDVLGVIIGLVGVMSSGFGPFFIAGIGALLLVRRRWKAAVLATLPLALAYGWWWIRWGADPAADRNPGDKLQVPMWAGRAMRATLHGMTGHIVIGVLATLAMFVALFGESVSVAGRRLAMVLFGTCSFMFLGIATQRVGLGMQLAASSRYVYMGAMLLGPAFALGIDVARRSQPALWTARLVLVGSALVNISWLDNQSTAWAQMAANERTTLELLTGSPQLTATLDPEFRPLPFSPDLRIGDLPTVVAEGAVVPRVPVTDFDRALLRLALAAPQP